MDDLARRFRRSAEQRTGLRYPQELRQLALEYAAKAMERGENRREIAAALSLSEATLLRWQETETVGPAALHEVVVVERAGGGGPALVTPSGIRVEGLSVRDLVMILEALG